MIVLRVSFPRPGDDRQRGDLLPASSTSNKVFPSRKGERNSRRGRRVRARRHARYRLAAHPFSITLSLVGEMYDNTTYLTPRTPTPQLHHFDNFHRARPRVLLSCAFLKPLNRSLMLSVDDWAKSKSTGESEGDLSRRLDAPKCP